MLGETRPLTSLCLKGPPSYFLSPLPSLACPAAHAAGSIPRSLQAASWACAHGALHLTVGECQAIDHDEQATGAAHTPDSHGSSHGSFLLGLVPASRAPDWGKELPTRAGMSAP